MYKSAGIPPMRRRVRNRHRNSLAASTNDPIPRLAVPSALLAPDPDRDSAPRISGRYFPLPAGPIEGVHACGYETRTFLIDAWRQSPTIGGSSDLVRLGEWQLRFRDD